MGIELQALHVTDEAVLVVRSAASTDSGSPNPGTLHSLLVCHCCICRYPLGSLRKFEKGGLPLRTSFNPEGRVF